MQSLQMRFLSVLHHHSVPLHHCLMWTMMRWASDRIWADRFPEATVQGAAYKQGRGSVLPGNVYGVLFGGKLEVLIEDDFWQQGGHSIILE